MANKNKDNAGKSAKEASCEALSQIEGLAPEMAEVIESLPVPQRKIIVESILAIQQESFSGPIPHPRILEGYENIHSGFAERIARMAEKEQAHRFSCDDKVIDSTIAAAKRGQWMGCIIAIVFGIITLILGLMGEVIIASIFGVLGFIVMVAIFIKSQSGGRDKKES